MGLCNYPIAIAVSVNQLSPAPWAASLWSRNAKYIGPECAHAIIVQTSHLAAFLQQSAFVHSSPHKGICMTLSTDLTGLLCKLLLSTNKQWCVIIPILMHYLKFGKRKWCFSISFMFFFQPNSHSFTAITITNLLCYLLMQPIFIILHVLIITPNSLINAFHLCLCRPSNTQLCILH